MQVQIEQALSAGTSALDVHDFGDYHRQPEDYESLLVLAGHHKGL